MDLHFAFFAIGISFIFLQEFDRQKDYMGAQISSVRKHTHQKVDNLRHDNTRKTAENTLLVKEINDLRHEKKVWSHTMYVHF